MVRHGQIVFAESLSLDASVFLLEVSVSSFRSVEIWSKDSQETKLKEELQSSHQEYRIIPTKF